MKTITKEMLDEVVGGGLYEDAPLEVILDKARESAIMVKECGQPLDYALDNVSRYFCVPGRVEREEIFPIIREVYAQQ